jgi:hypothetical protein
VDLRKSTWGGAPLQGVAAAAWLLRSARQPHSADKNRCFFPKPTVIPVTLEADNRTREWPEKPGNVLAGMSGRPGVLPHAFCPSWMPWVGVLGDPVTCPVCRGGCFREILGGFRPAVLL